MRILMVPLSAMVDTAGSYHRVNALAKEFITKGIEVATCAALDCNYKNKNHIKNYYLTVPSPFGMPECIGKKFFTITKKLGLSTHKNIRSFDEVLHFTGAISQKYFSLHLTCIRKAIQDYKPDLIYSEFNVAAIVAARIEKVTCFADYSYPVQSSYACNKKYAKGVNQILQQNGMKPVNSVLDIFEWADKLIVPSCEKLEPIRNDKVMFTGPFDGKKVINSNCKKNKVLAYMGNGTISSNRLKKEIIKAFYHSEYEVYLAIPESEKSECKNIHIASWFPFESMLDEAAAYIHHGGQNSCMDALSYGVPQIICPGKIFERKYNAKSMEVVGTGITITHNEFNANKISECMKLIKSDKNYRKNSEALGIELAALGGATKVAEEIILSTSTIF
jgi:uncharacterized protein (TIGR00661 family)